MITGIVSSGNLVATGIALVQSKGSHLGSGTSHSITWDASPTSGNKLILAAYRLNSSTTFTGPSGWTSNLTVGAGSSLGLYWWEKQSDGTETTVTVTSDITAGFGLCGFEVSGLVTGTAKDVSSNGTNATVTSKSTGTTATLAQANEFAVSLVCVNGTSGGSEAWTNSFTLEHNIARGWSGYKILSATTGVETTASWTTSRFANAGVVTYKGA